MLTTTLWITRRCLSVVVWWAVGRVRLSSGSASSLFLSLALALLLLLTSLPLLADLLEFCRRDTVSVYRTLLGERVEAAPGIGKTHASARALMKLSPVHVRHSLNANASRVPWGVRLGYPTQPNPGVAQVAWGQINFEQLMVCMHRNTNPARHTKMIISYACDALKK